MEKILTMKVAEKKSLPYIKIHPDEQVGPPKELQIDPNMELSVLQ